MAPVIAIALPGSAAMATLGIANVFAPQVLSPRPKKPMPTPVPALVGALTNAVIACVTASQRVGCTGVAPIGNLSQALSDAGQSIEPDLSSMMKMSTGMARVSWA